MCVQHVPSPKDAARTKVREIYFHCHCHDSTCICDRGKTAFSNEITDHEIFLGGSQEQRLCPLALCTEPAFAALSAKRFIHEPLSRIWRATSFHVWKVGKQFLRVWLQLKVSSFCRLNMCTQGRWIQRLWTL